MDGGWKRLLLLKEDGVRMRAEERSQREEIENEDESEAFYTGTSAAA